MANRSRGPNMSLQEDIALCKAYVKISEDPLTASQQKKDKFWDRVYQDFESLTPNIHQRTSGTLANRFALISRDVFLYIEKLSQVEKRKESSWTDADVICEARKDFRSNYNKAFGFEECYQILKSMPKYSLNTAKMENTCSSQEEGGASSLATPSGHNVNLNPDIDAAIDLEAPYDSPPGRTSEKKRARKKAKGVDTSMCSSILEETTSFNAFFKETALKKEEDRKALNAKIDKLIEIKEKEEEDRIMSIDLNSVSEHQRIYFERRQTEVLARCDLLGSVLYLKNPSSN